MYFEEEEADFKEKLILTFYLKNLMMKIKKQMKIMKMKKKKLFKIFTLFLKVIKLFFF